MRTTTSYPAPGCWGRFVFTALVLVALAAAPAAAQKSGKKIGHTRRSPVTSGSAAPLATSAAADPSTLQFGSWLDDASMLAPGEAWTSLSFGYFRLSGSGQTNFPIVDASVGLTKRAQFGVTVPYYRVHLPNGPAMGGLGDVYLSAKVSLLNPADSTRSFGVALSPIIEILEDPDANGGRWSWAAPVDLQCQAGNYKIFGSTGVFSRGAIFGSGAIQVPINDRLALFGAVTFTRSLKEDTDAQALGIPRSRGDVTAAAAYFISPVFAAFVGTGRTLGSNPSATSFMLTGGVSMAFTPRPAP